MIRCVFWDIDGTLLNFKKSERYALEKMFDRYGLGTLTPKLRASYSAINDSYWERLEKGLMKKNEILIMRFVDFFKKENIPYKGEVEQFEHDYLNALGEKIFLNDDCIEVLKAVRSMNIKQYATTNGSKLIQRKKLTMAGFDPLFDDYFISDEIGAEKPSKAYSDYVFSHIEPFDPKEILIVGDSRTSDMRFGNDAGIRCCLYRCKDDGEFTYNVNSGTDDGLLIDYCINDLNEVLDIIRTAE